MIILGVSVGPGAGAALVRDGELVAAVAQERVDRVRGSTAFPSAAIDAVLDVAGVRAREVDRVTFGGTVPPDALLRGRSAGATDARAPTRGGPMRARLKERLSPRLRDAVRGYQSALRATGLYMVEQDLHRKLVEPALRDLGFDRAAIGFVEHDRALATAAYRCQDRGDVLIIVLDNPTGGAAVTVNVGRHLQLDRFFLQTSFATVSAFPARVARALGVRVADISALAAGGRAPPALREAFAPEIGLSGDGFTVRPFVPEPDPLAARIAVHAPADVAAAARDAIEAVVRAFVRRWVERTGIRHVVLGGGVFADPWLCGRLLLEPSVESLSVFPAPSEGLAVGAALGTAGSAMHRLPSLGLGPRFTADQCYKALSVASLPRHKQDDPVAALARAIEEGRTVARFDGALELSPGGLGNRVVLFRADRPDVRDRALAALRQPAWSTVGCAIRSDEAPRGIPDVARAFGACLARSAALAATADFAAAHLGIVNRDGTVLPNLVDATEEADLHRLLGLLETGTGLAAVGQLDFRVADEPIVCTPGDAIRAWRASDVDVLFLGPYRVDRSALAS